MLYLVLEISEYDEYAGYTSKDPEGKTIKHERKSAFCTADRIYKTFNGQVVLKVDTEEHDFDLTGRALYTKEAVDRMCYAKIMKEEKLTDVLKGFPFGFL